MIEFVLIMLCVGLLISIYSISQLVDKIRDLKEEIQLLNVNMMKSINDVNKDITMVERTLMQQIKSIEKNQHPFNDWLKNGKQILKG